MDYNQTLEYLYNCMPMFQKIGSKAYKEGLENTYMLDEHFGHPHRTYPTIHLAGTNGKGSCSHTLAAILQKAGYKTGLYTSPHLVDFGERIRVDGEMIPPEYIIRFVEEHRSFFEPLHPSFFEVTTALAFSFFADQRVDVAVIETGLGGRLDCTNIISPDLAVITNISPDHTSLLGDSIEKIAFEKAGIIKPGTPVIIGEATDEIRKIFIKKAGEVGAPILFAEDEQWILHTETAPNGDWLYETRMYKNLTGELHGIYQLKNTNTILSAVNQLVHIGYHIQEAAVRDGFAQVTTLTGLQGRWQTLQTHPTIICDTGHNVAGMQQVSEQLKTLTYNRLHMVIGMVNDKDVSGVMALLPADAHYYFTKPNIGRALPENELMAIANRYNLSGEAYPDVPSALKAAQKNCLPTDVIFVGGSSFIVADLLANRDTFNFH